MSKRRCGYTKGQNVTCQVAVKGATTDASVVQMVPCTGKSRQDDEDKPDLYCRHKWRWRAEGSTKTMSVRTLYLITTRLMQQGSSYYTVYSVYCAYSTKIH